MAKSAHFNHCASPEWTPPPQHFSYIPTPSRTITAELLASSAPPVRWVRISTERQNILDVLRDHNQMMTPKEIAELLDVPSRNVRQLLFHMLRDGEVITPWKTGYRIAPE